MQEPEKTRVFLPFLPYNAAMTRDEIIEKLKERETDLRAQGVAHAALFGSVARGDDNPDSDIADMFDRPVDVVSRESLKPRLRPSAAADAIYAF